jgi:uncharacterized coiled-coil protein SlyX
MSNEKDKEAIAVTEMLSGVKVLLPFAITLLSLAGVWYDSRNQVAVMQKDIVNATASRAKNEARIESLSLQVTAQELTLTEVKSDLKHIKDDTKETLDLVREWMRGHN